MRSEAEIRAKLAELITASKRFPRLGHITIRIVLLEWILEERDSDVP